MSTKPPPEIAFAIECMGQHDRAGWRAAMRDAIGRYNFVENERAELYDRLTRLEVKQGVIPTTTQASPSGSEFFADAAAQPQEIHHGI